MTRYFIASCVLLCLLAVSVTYADEATPFETFGSRYSATALPTLRKYCLDCHSAVAKEGELDLERYATIEDLRADPSAWQGVARMLADGEMPPKDSDQPTTEELRELRTWVDDYLDAEARSRAGDPGPVVLRRLNNAEYAYTLRDLTGVESLDPAREFPVDGAAGEGFTNTGQALAMSPALLAKYLEAAKEVADHAVPLPDGIRFSPSVSRRDWTNEALARIRDFYRDRTAPMQSAEVRLHGLVWESADGGKLPLADYVEATVVERDALESGETSIEQVAGEHDLSPKYLARLWTELHRDEPTALFGDVRERWRLANAGDVPALVAAIEDWQQALWTFNRVGHIGRVGGPSAWMEPVSPLASRFESRTPLSLDGDAGSITLHLVAGDAGDGSEGDVVLWERPRFVADGEPDLPLRDLRDVLRRSTSLRDRALKSAGVCLEALETAPVDDESFDPAALAKTRDIDVDVLSAWIEILGIRTGETTLVGTYEKRLPIGDYDFVRGWGPPETPNLVANASDDEVRIPGTLKGRSVAVHPSPTLDSFVGWKSPAAATMRIDGHVQDAHLACGNGVTWRLELRRGKRRSRLASGATAGGEVAVVGPIESLRVRAGDVVTLVIGARDGSHVCDLTDIDLTLTEVGDAGRRWSLAADLTGDLPVENPQSDRYGNDGVWHFGAEPIASGDHSASDAIVEGTALLWSTESDADERRRLRATLAKLCAEGPDAETSDADRRLYDRLASPTGPWLAMAIRNVQSEVDADEASDVDAEGWGLDAERFGKGPRGEAIDAMSLCVAAPSVISIEIPTAFAEKYQFVVDGTLLTGAGDGGSVQLDVTTDPPADRIELRADRPIIVRDDGDACARFEKAFADFRDLFPAALCYTRIVPTDEVVTLRLIHREDEPLRRLFLSNDEIAQVDRAWDELHFVGQDAIRQVDAYEQLMEYATQDADPSVFAPLRGPILEAADAFRRRLIETEPVHVEAVIVFAGRAWRRPLTETERQGLRRLYDRFRAEEFPHDEALRLLIARVLTSPAFLYRLETPPPGTKAMPVGRWELATRLSYFLWSSAPDETLRDAAANGELATDEGLRDATRRMLRDDRVRRLATEFACQWLHVRDFATYDEKSERAFPEFAAIQNDMAEEPIRFFTDLFQNDRSVLSIVDADTAVVNRDLAELYGIPWTAGDADGDWRRVENVRPFGRGGALGMAAILAKQSGASRTSPVLRGTFVSETLLGERLPRPPKNVPPLPDDVPEGLNERELVERHVADASCARCHARIDPFGFALERYDAVGRHRDRYADGEAVDASTTLADGTRFDGIDGLRAYLAGERRDDFLRQFCRKLLGYALGRGVRLSDEPLLDEMVARLEANEYRVSVAIEAVVLSRQFREIRGADFAD